jgi:hypothetical protein
MPRLRAPDPVVPPAQLPLARLEQRIAHAFTNGIRATEVSALIQQVEVATRSASESATRARERALDPTLNGSELNSARQTMHDSGFAVERLQAASSRLRQRLDELRAAELNQRKRKEYDRVAAERDELATKLSAIYPDFAEKLGALLPQLAANDHEVNIINRDRPAGAPMLLCAELKARGLASFQVGVSQLPRLTDVLVLPKWRLTAHSSLYCWPLR